MAISDADFLKLMDDFAVFVEGETKKIKAQHGPGNFVPTSMSPYVQHDRGKIEGLQQARIFLRMLFESSR